MKYESLIEILISLSKSVMQALDSKQIEAHFELAGFENISTKNTIYGNFYYQ